MQTLIPMCKPDPSEGQQIPTVYANTARPSDWRAEFFVSGPPVGKQRPRLGKRRTYTPAKTVVYENHVAWCAKSVMRNYSSGGGWYVLELDIAHENHTYPDADNVVKSIMDALEGIVWKNDKTVLPVVKSVSVGSSNPGVRVVVRETEAF